MFLLKLPKRYLHDDGSQYFAENEMHAAYITTICIYKYYMYIFVYMQFVSFGELTWRFEGVVNGKPFPCKLCSGAVLADSSVM